MTGTEHQRRQSARLLSILLALVAGLALVGAGVSMTMSEARARDALVVAAAFALLALLAGLSSTMEWRRAEMAERVAMLTAMLASPLTIYALLQGWWVFAPLLGIGTLGLFLALAFRFSVRNAARHPEIRFSS